MRLLEYEQLIKTAVKSDRSDPQIYDNLQKMTYMFLRRKKCGDCPKDVEDISYLIAGDVFMDIINGVEITYYLGYLEKIYKGYIRQYYEGRQNQVPYDPSIDANLRLLGDLSLNDFAVIRNKVYLEQINSVVNKVMEESCKYKYGTSTYNNLKLSLLLSILRSRLVSFHLSTEHKFYLKLLIIRFYNEVKLTSDFDIENEFI